MNQEEIVKLIYVKDENSFALLYDCYAKSLFGIISCSIKDHEKAEKILIDVFEDTWHSLDTYSENRSRFYSWLVDKTRRHIVDYLKESNQNNSNATCSFVELLADENKPETIGIQEYVRKLRPRSIKIIDQLFFKGVPLVELAEKLEISSETLLIENKSSIDEIRNLLEA